MGLVLEGDPLERLVEVVLAARERQVLTDVARGLPHETVARRWSRPARQGC